LLNCPKTGERFEGLFAAVTLSACFAIRKTGTTTFVYQITFKAQIASPVMAKGLGGAVAGRRNILVPAGPALAKTTAGQRAVAEVAGLDQRVVIIEALGNCDATPRDAVLLRTKPASPRLPTSWLDAFGCDLTGSWSASFGARKPSTCSKPGTPAIPAESQPYNRNSAPRPRSIGSQQLISGGGNDRSSAA